MRRSTFKRPKMVLIFNGAQVLVAITRSLHSAAEIELSDLGTLMLKDYDILCGEKRTYYPVRKMAHKRALLENKHKSDNKKKGGNDYERE